MFDRRAFLQAALIAPIPFSATGGSLAQTSDPKPDFDIAGSAHTDPAGFEIAWGSIWSEVDVSGLTFNPIPGQTGFIVLDSEERPSGRFTTKQRIVIETNAVSGPVDPQELMNSFEDLYPSTNMGYAPGTVIESRHVTDRGCWFSFGPGPQGGGIEGVIGISLFYTPTDASTPLLNISFNLGTGPLRTEAFLEEMDSTISINGDWLLGMDDLGNFWEAIETSYGWYD